MAGIEGYTYKALENTRSQIRLLWIEESSDAADLSFTLTSWKESDAPEFAAISYTWGQAAIPENSVIIIDGNSCRIRENARYALSQVVPRARELSIAYIWMDALCIDQSNLQEKGHQVQKLGGIFGSAAQVFACVGPEENDSAYGIMTLILEDSKGRIMDPSRKDPALKHFSQRSYWSRLWIVQELFSASAKNVPVSILCGSAQCSMQTLAEAIYSLRGRSTANILDDSMRQVLDAVSERVPKDICSVVSAFGQSQCSDIRDHVYGLLSLIQWPTKLPLLPADYTISTIELAGRLLPHLANSEQRGLAVDWFHPQSVETVSYVLWVLEVYSSAQVRSSNSEVPGYCNYQVSAFSGRIVGQGPSPQSLALGDIDRKTLDKFNNLFAHVSTQLGHSLDGLRILYGSDDSSDGLDHEDSFMLPIGIACPQAETGDRVVQIWNLKGSGQLGLVLRPQENSEVYRIVGRAWLLHGGCFQPCSLLGRLPSACGSHRYKLAEVCLHEIDLLALLAGIPDGKELHPNKEWFLEPVEYSEMSSYAKVDDASNVDCVAWSHRYGKGDA